MNFSVFIVLNIIIHAVLFLSIFDIYFTSPIVHGMKLFEPEIEPPASRLVLFVADGLRADKLYELDENGQTRSPYLRNIIMNEGTWGVSHTQVPTESRPGHVAMIAGFYEDVSAVMKGWKENPIDFDSVFNQSSQTWGWGSPDILPMFAKGESISHVHMHCYSGDIESFAGDSSELLDEWVFDNLIKFFENSKSNQTAFKLLNQNKIVFFLHLLGIDTNGHSHNPDSKEYLSNINYVDQGIKRSVELIDNFYGNDAKTAYVFTADHGMTDWGSHGAGLPSETLTPLIVWGSGAKKHENILPQHRSDIQQQTKAWGLDPSLRIDVNQADIAPLMSSLIGIPIPANSVGVLPTHYLSVDSETKAKLLLINAKQMAEQFLIKMQTAKDKSIFFTPYPDLSISSSIDFQRTIQELIKGQKYEDSNAMSLKLIQLSQKGLKYYHTYHRTILYTAVVCSYIGLIIVELLMVLQKVGFISRQSNKLMPLNVKQKNDSVAFLFIAIGVFVSFLLYLLDTKISYYVYFNLPICIWYQIFLQRYSINVSLTILISNKELVRQLLLYCVIGMIGIWSLVGTFFYRHILTIELIIFALLIYKTRIRKKTKTGWIAVCCCLSIFPLLPVVGRAPNNFLVFFGGILGTMLVHKAKPNFLCILPLISGILAPTAAYTSKSYGYVPLFVHVLSWTFLLSSWVIPLFSSTNMWERITTVFACHCATYILISLSYDAVFCVVFCVLLYMWIVVELEVGSEGKSSSSVLDFSSLNLDADVAHEISFSSLRQSYMFLFFIVFAFFGVGNIASINSFDVKIVLPFVTIFDPFIMGGLLAYKVLLPYLLVACSLCCIAIATKTHVQQLFCFVLIMSDIMGLHFFFLVRDEGSWLDIGTSISHYVISMSMAISLLIFFAASKLLTTFKFNLR